MSRPKPKILLEQTDKQTYKTQQVLSAEGIWAVFYKDKPINLKSMNILVSYPGPKYQKVSFSNPGHAFNLSRKLNKQFKTNDFSVVFFEKGRTVEKHEYD